MKVPDEVEAALLEAFRSKDLGGLNTSMVDVEARGCVMRVLGRRGLGAFRFAFVWPVITVEVHPGTPDARKFVYDIRDTCAEESSR